MKEYLIGADWYPEDWDESEIDADLKKMLDMGFNTVRIGEFAWSKDEPEEGRFDFDWLEKTVDKCEAAGINVIMGTPTATPPRWFLKKYPDAASLDFKGIRASHGGRRHCCSSNPNYREKSRIIVEELAKRFGDKKAVVGWQIDNEIYHHPDKGYCVCEHCLAAFREHLKKKYGTVQKLNKSWNLSLFSQEYDSFEDIPAPFNTWHNPHIKLEWLISQASNHADFVNMQADIIRRYSKAPIGTDTMPLNGFDYRSLEKGLDVVQFNCYYRPEHWHSAAMWLDYMRGFSKESFWITETQPSWPGSTGQHFDLPPEGYIYFNSMLGPSLGGGGLLYWLWRTHWAGHELMHGAVLETCGRPAHTAGEIKRAASDAKRLYEALGDCSCVSDAALIFTSLNWNMALSQDISEKLKKPGMSDGIPNEFYKAMLKTGIHPHVVDLCEDISSYKLIVCPGAFTLEEGGFGERVSQWVKDGGVLLAGPLTDIRTSIGAKYKDRAMGFLEELSGARLEYTVPGGQNDLTVENRVGEKVVCRDSFELFSGLEPLMIVKDGHSALKGLCVAGYRKVGKGYVVLLGSFPEEKELCSLLKLSADMAGAERSDISGDLIVTKMKGEKSCTVVANGSAERGEYRFSGNKKELLSDKEYDSAITLEPYSVAVLF